MYVYVRYNYALMQSVRWSHIRKCMCICSILFLLLAHFGYEKAKTTCRTKAIK